MIDNGAWFSLQANHECNYRLVTRPITWQLMSFVAQRIVDAISLESLFHHGRLSQVSLLEIMRG